MHPWPVLLPGLALVLATLGFNLLGDGLRDADRPAAARHGSADATLAGPPAVMLPAPSEVDDDASELAARGGPVARRRWTADGP